ncbi:MAG: hypothetical protein MK078_13320 [Crocinitomicaceae bacterium]|nr:hypothetical protein [Crocinitomicaceae bacterium]
MSAVFAVNSAVAQNGVVNLVFSETVQDAVGYENTVMAKGHVQFEHDNAKLYCDSALWFRTPNIVKAYGTVQINQNDTINLFCDTLVYFGNEKIAKLKSNVRFRDNEYKMVTDSLTYDGDKMQGYYRNWAVISSIKSEMKLTSRIGYYYSKRKTFFFRDSVHITDPEFELFADTLEFRTPTSTMHFHGPTTILMDTSSTLYCNEGTYFTKDGYAELWNGATLLQDETSVYADSLLFNQKSDIGEGFCNVKIRDTTENTEIRSDYLYKYPGQEHLKLGDNAKIIQFNDPDTLIIVADTIDWQKDTLTSKQLAIAEYNVNIFNGPVIVVCDSASYIENDSILKLHKDPIIWNDDNQLTADSVIARIYEGNFDQIDLYDNCMLIGFKDSVHYDQIKGKDMQVVLDSNKIKNIYVEKNAQTLYFLEQEQEDSLKTKEVTGMNKIECNEIVVYFMKGEIDRVKFNEDPDATFYPIEQAPKSELFLKGFLWEIERKPYRIVLE